MVGPPRQSKDAFDQALGFFGQDPREPNGFQTGQVPSVSGYGTRQSRVRNNRPAVRTRKMVNWMIPEGPIIQMYVNPSKIVTSYKKNIPKQRTKGGFVIQYWGEDLIDIDISGTTGTSGIEGINVLYDLYRNEQLAFDPYALFQAAKLQQDTYAGDVFGQGWLGGSGGTDIATSAEDIENIFDGDDVEAGDAIGSMLGLVEESALQSARKAPTLASLAATVEMYWSGEVYRGFFDSFTVTESADNIGFFDYGIKFVATQKRGLRLNFFAWHRSAVSGPSDSDPNYGRPHSFGSLSLDSPANPST
jgi:hypothetical protein